MISRLARASASAGGRGTKARPIAAPRTSGSWTFTRRSCTLVQTDRDSRVHTRVVKRRSEIVVRSTQRFARALRSDQLQQTFTSNQGSDRDRHLVSRDSLTKLALVNMAKTNRSVSSGPASSRDARDLRALLHVPQHDLQSQLASRLERLGFPSLRPAQVQIMSAVGAFAAADSAA